MPISRSSTRCLPALSPSCSYSLVTQLRRPQSVLAQRAVEPAEFPADWSRALPTRPSLQEQQPRQVIAPAVLDRHHLPAEHGDLLAAWYGVVERHLEEVVGEHSARLPERGHNHTLLSLVAQTER
jgi:hypothetical protein